MIYLEPRNTHDCAIIGKEKNRLIYSYSKLVEIYMQDGLTYIESVEYIEFNIIGMYMKDWPIIHDDLTETM